MGRARLAAPAPHLDLSLNSAQAVADTDRVCRRRPSRLRCTIPVPRSDERRGATRGVRSAADARAHPGPRPRRVDRAHPSSLLGDRHGAARCRDRSATDRVAVRSAGRRAAARSDRARRHGCPQLPDHRGAREPGGEGRDRALRRRYQHLRHRRRLRRHGRSDLVATIAKAVLNRVVQSRFDGSLPPASSGCLQRSPAVCISCRRPTRSGRPTS
jgi:hypothetical protein